MDKILFKDLIKDKSYEELMNLIPCMVCRDDSDYKYIYNRYYSYNVVGFGPNYVILGSYTTSYNEDDFDYEIDTYKIVKFEDINERYVYAHELTDKQKEWYERKGKNYKCVSGYEAWHVINDAIEKEKKRNEIRKQNETRIRDEFDEDDYYMYECDIWGRQ